MAQVPDYVENESAYIAATERRIKANAMKGRAARWLKEDPTRADLAASIREKAYDTSSKFWNDMANQIDEWGSLSERQEAACRRILDEDVQRKADRIAAKRAADAGSAHVGTIGERRKFTVTVAAVIELVGQYGLSFINITKDEAGNVIVYKGTNAWTKGEQITVKATIKAHTERDGVKQTNISRPAAVAG
jgi:hypothetical protein